MACFEYALKILMINLYCLLPTQTTIPYISSSAYHILYGDLSNFDDIMSIDLNYNDTDETEDDSLPTEIEILNEMDHIEMTSQFNSTLDPDLNEYNLINKEGDSRKSIFAGLFWLHNDYDDPVNIEEEKKTLLLKAGLQFLIHTRYKLKDAFQVRKIVRNDKRYRLGYLFNRLRRLLIEMHKIVWTSNKFSSKEQFYKLKVMLKLYEKASRLDYDIRDTTRHIKEVYHEKSAFD